MRLLLVILLFTVTLSAQYYDVTCDVNGSNADTILTNAYNAAAVVGGTVRFSGTCIIAQTHYVTHPNVTFQGFGMSSVLKAADNAWLGQLIYITGSGYNFTTDNIVFDGNRGTGGMNQGSDYVLSSFISRGRFHRAIGGTIQGSPAYALLLNNASGLRVIDTVFRNSQETGVFVGDNSVSPKHILFRGAVFEDNGGTLDSTGAGIGVYFGGSHPVEDVLIEGGRFVRNYNTVTTPGNSNGVSGTSVKGVKIHGVHFEDNLNAYFGGQINLSGSGEGSCPYAGGGHIIDGNTFKQTITFAGDHTSGIEDCSPGANVVNNNLEGFTGAAIVLDGGTPDGTVGNNVAVNSATCLLIGDATGFQINGNRFKCPTAVNFSSQNASDISLESNDLRGSTTPITGLPLPASQNIYIGHNAGYN